MERVQIHRYPDSTHGTLGSAYHNDERLCWSLELPGRENKPDYSRIPAGTYTCEWHKSPRFGWTYHVQAVPGRSFILIHAGNLAGDRERGLLTHTHGCILFGNRIGVLSGQLAVLESRTAVRRFSERLEKQSFILEIIDA